MQTHIIGDAGLVAMSDIDLTTNDAVKAITFVATTFDPLLETGLKLERIEGCKHRKFPFFHCPIMLFDIRLCCLMRR